MILKGMLHQWYRHVHSWLHTHLSYREGMSYHREVLDLFWRKKNMLVITSRTEETKISMQVTQISLTFQFLQRIATCTRTYCDKHRPIFMMLYYPRNLNKATYYRATGKTMNTWNISGMFIVLHVWPIPAKIKTRKLATTTNMVINDLACGLVFLHLIGFFWEYNNISEIFLVLVVFLGWL